jgi:hypothetical protein
MVSDWKWATLVTLIATAALSFPTFSLQGINTDLSNGASFTFDIGKNLPPFTFKIIPNKQPPDQFGNADSTIDDIEVYRGDSKSVLQHLEGCDLGSMEPPPDRDGWFRADDYNFDGYKDIFLMTNWGATGNFGGCIWLFNPKTGRFDYNKEFSDIEIHDVDPDTKTLSTISNSSADEWRAERYAVENNHPVLIRSWDQTSDNGKIHCEIDERRNGKMVKVSDAHKECPADAYSR